MSNIRDFNIESQTGKDLLKQIREGLPSMKLRSADNRGNREYEKVKSLDAIVKRLLEELKLGVRGDDVQICTITHYPQHLGYTVWQISNGITIRNTTGPGYLIPINIKGNAHLNSEETLRYGCYSYYNGVTDLTPELDCIFVVQKTK